MNELKRLRDRIGYYEFGQPNGAIAAELDAILRKYEEPTEAMVDAGAKAIRNDSGLTTKSGLEWGEYEQGARACFKAMIEAEDQDHE